MVGSQLENMMQQQQVQVTQSAYFITYNCFTAQRKQHLVFILNGKEDHRPSFLREPMVVCQLQLWSAVMKTWSPCKVFMEKSQAVNWTTWLLLSKKSSPFLQAWHRKVSEENKGKLVYWQRRRSQAHIFPTFKKSAQADFGAKMVHITHQPPPALICHDEKCLLILKNPAKQGVGSLL